MNLTTMYTDKVHPPMRQTLSLSAEELQESSLVSPCVLDGEDY